MKDRSNLLEQICEGNNLLRNAPMNRDDLYPINIKVTQASSSEFHFITGNVTKMYRINLSCGALYTRQPHLTGYKTYSNF